MAPATPLPSSLNKAKISRRRLLTTAAAGLAGLAFRPASAAVTGIAARRADLASPKGQRLVIVGGGWSGLTIAKYVKLAAPELDVVLVEKRASFVSHPLSNLMLAGLVGIDSLRRSYSDGAARGNYTYIQAALAEADFTARRVFTDKGFIDYDFLVIAPGVEYDYASFGITDPAEIQLLERRYPGGFVSPDEHLIIKRKVDAFEGGAFVLTAPPGIFRCSASPYERACMIASVFKRKKLAAKVILIDSRDAPAVKAEGFLAAFEELYGDHIEYINSTVIEGIDAPARTIKTDFDDIKFGDGAIYPRIRASRLIEKLGLANAGSPQKEARIDPFKYNVIGDERVYITGDCRPMPFSKSASVAHTEGQYVARVIAGRARGKGDEAPWTTPLSVCYSMVNTDPREAILSRSTYRFDTASKQWSFAEGTKGYNDRTKAMGAATQQWTEQHLADLFG
jgi:sulfide dehydrogenase [flavocytochrome c] flavoprotein chain